MEEKMNIREAMIIACIYLYDKGHEFKEMYLDEDINNLKEYYLMKAKRIFEAYSVMINYIAEELK